MKYRVSAILLDIFATFYQESNISNDILLSSLDFKGCHEYYLEEEKYYNLEPY